MWQWFTWTTWPLSVLYSNRNCTGGLKEWPNQDASLSNGTLWVSYVTNTVYTFRLQRKPHLTVGCPTTLSGSRFSRRIQMSPDWEKYPTSPAITKNFPVHWKPTNPFWTWTSCVGGLMFFTVSRKNTNPDVLTARNWEHATLSVNGRSKTDSDEVRKDKARISSAAYKESFTHMEDPTFDNHHPRYEAPFPVNSPSVFPSPKFFWVNGSYEDSVHEETIQLSSEDQHLVSEISAQLQEGIPCHNVSGKGRNISQYHYFVCCWRSPYTPQTQFVDNIFTSGFFKVLEAIVVGEDGKIEKEVTTTTSTKTTWWLSVTILDLEVVISPLSTTRNTGLLGGWTGQVEMTLEKTKSKSTSVLQPPGLITLPSTR